MAKTNATALTGVADSAKNAIFEAATNTQLWLKVAEYLYKLVTAPSPLDNDRDLPRYQRATRAYLDMGYEEIPKQWKLDKNNCPTYQSTFREQRNNLQAQLDNFDKCNHSMKLEIQGIASNICDLFDSLSDRFIFDPLHPLRGRYRVDGIESMFLNELAMWLIIELPRYDIKNEETANLVYKRIEYCQSIQKCALIFENDDDIANPKQRLDSVIHSLKRLQANLEHAHRGSNFSDKMTTITNHVKQLTRDTFNILYLMLEQTNSSEFQVAEFVSKDNEGCQNQDKLKQYLLTQWILKTCDDAGISHNDFISNKAISFESIDKHLSYTLPNQKNLEELGFRKFINQLGFHDFIWKTDIDTFGKLSSTQAKEYLEGTAIVSYKSGNSNKVGLQHFLNSIINLHRSILRMAYISKILNAGMHVARDWGEIWLFSDGAKPILEGLIVALQDAIMKHKAALNAFWSIYYTKTFIPFSKKYAWDCNNSKIFCKVELQISRFMSGSENTIKSTNNTIRKLIEYVNSTRIKKAESANKDLQFMTTHIHNYLSNYFLSLGGENYTQYQLKSLQNLMGITTVNPIQVIVHKDGPSPVPVIPIVTDHVLEQVAYKSAVEYSLANLDRNTGKTKIRNILDELINASYELLKAGPYASDVEMTVRTQRRDMALTRLKAYLAPAVAKGHSAATKPHKQQKSRSAPSVAAPSSFTFTKVEAKILLDIDKLYHPSKEEINLVPKFSKISDLYHQSEILEQSQLHSLIYEKILESYKDIAEADWTSLRYQLTSANDYGTLEKHYAKLITTLRWVADQPDLYKPENAPLIEVINGYLISGLDKMCEDLKWIKIDSSLALQLNISKVSVMIVKDEEHIEIMSPKMLEESQKRIEESAKAAQQLLIQNKKPIVNYQAGVKPVQPKFEQQPAAFRPSLVANSNIDKSKVKSNK